MQQEHSLSLDKRIEKLRSKRLMTDLFEWPRVPLLKRELSSNERQEREAPRKRDVYKCVHGKHYFVACAPCKRTRSDADKWLAHYEQKLQSR